MIILSRKRKKGQSLPTRSHFLLSACFNNERRGSMAEGSLQLSMDACNWLQSLTGKTFTIK